MLAAMARFMLTHRHEPNECPVAFASWRGFESPLRRAGATASCTASGGSAHLMWWTVEASNEDEALEQLPAWIAERTEISRVNDVPIP
jgi:hypothetical protein